MGGVNANTLDNFVVSDKTLTFTLGLEGIEIEIVINANTDTEFLVEYWKEILDPHDFNMFASKKDTGMTNSVLDKETISRTYVRNAETFLAEQYRQEDFFGSEFAYFEAFLGDADISTRVVISGDGRTVIKLYFALVEIKVEVQYNDRHVLAVEISPQQEGYKFGSRISVSATQRQGYLIVGWQVDGASVSGVQTDDDLQVLTLTLNYDHDIVISIQSDVGTANFTVEYYFELIDQDEDELRDILIRSGRTESQINVRALAEPFEGYVYDQSRSEDRIYYVEGDGSTVVRIYYTLIWVEMRVAYQTGIDAVDVRGYLRDDGLEFVNGNSSGTVLYYRVKYSKQLKLTVSTERGYVFAGWSLTLSEGKKQKLENSSAITGFLFNAPAQDFLLTAETDNSIVTIFYNPNNGTGEIMEIQVKFGETFQLWHNLFTNGKKKFIGWATSPDGEIAFFDDDILTADFHGTLVLYAIWKETTSLMWLWILLIVLAVLIILIVLSIWLARRRNESKNKYMSKQ